MRFGAERSKGIHSGTAHDLGVANVSGVHQPGDVLSGEERFSADNTVSRTAYREAIRSLVAKGLVYSRSKSGTRVSDRERWNARPRIAPLFAVLLLALVGAAPAAKRPAAPLVLTAMHLHDPFIVADQATRTYHLFTRNEAAMTGDARLGTMMYTSRDLKHWTRPKVVFALPPNVWAKAGSWAPEVHRWRGRWYLFTTFHDAGARLGTNGKRATYRRGTVLVVADRIDGPYRLVRDGEPVVSKALMTLDGTLHVDAAGKPWLVYAHEWWQATVGTMEAVPLDDNLAQAGAPRVLFRADEAPWAVGQKQPDDDTVFVTDGPQLYRSRTGKLLMLWSSYGKKGYVEGQARSRSGTLAGPWEQMGVLVERDSGHGMLFRAFDGRLMMILHRPFNYALGKLYELRDDGDRLTVVREATELDGEAYPTHPCVPGHSSFDGATPGC